MPESPRHQLELALAADDLPRIEALVQEHPELLNARHCRPALMAARSGNTAGSEDTKCVMEVRMGGRPPVAVKSQESSVDQAITAATHKLKHLVESTLGRESSLAGHRDHG